MKESKMDGLRVRRWFIVPAALALAPACGEEDVSSGVRDSGVPAMSDAVGDDAETPSTEDGAGGQADASPADVGSPGDAGAGPGDVGVEPTDGGLEPPPPGARWTWATNASSRARGGASAASADGLVYVLGGREVQCATESLGYNPWTDEWFFGPGSSAYEPILQSSSRYVLMVESGFCGLSQIALDGFEVVDSWTGLHQFGRLPSFRFEPSVAFDGSDFLVAGGREGFGLEPYGFEPLRVNPATLELTRLSELGSPGRGRASASAWTGSELVVFGGTPESSGIWDPGSDSWRSLAMPPGTLVTPRSSANTGSALLVFDQGVGWSFDFGTEEWRGLASEGAPPSQSEYWTAWTGAEWIVFWSEGGAHYDPEQDSWRPANGAQARWPQRGDALAWTGRELVVYGTASARYGPQVAGSTVCDGLGTELEVDITAPSTRVVLRGNVSARAQVQNTLPLTRAEWSVDGEPVGSGLAVAFNVASLAPGTHVLRFEAEASGGDLACLERTFFIDELPVLSVVAPTSGLAQQSGTVDFDATCSDDRPGLCRLVLGYGDDEFVVSDLSLRQTIDLSVSDGLWSDYRIRAVDDRRQTTEASGAVLVVLSPLVESIASVPGEICDVRDGYALYLNNDRRFTIRHLDSEEDVLLPGVQGTCGRGSRLLEDGMAAVVDGGSIGRYWDGNSVALEWRTDDQRVAGNLVAYAAGSDLTLLDLGAGTTEVVAAGELARRNGYAISANGTIYWVTLAGEIRQWDRVTGNRTIASGITTEPYLVATDGGALWRNRLGPTWSIEAYDGAATRTLALGTTQWGNRGPRSGLDYAASGGQIAFTAPASGVLQVFVDGAGGPGTNAASEARLLSVEVDGDVWAAVDGVVQKLAFPDQPVVAVDVEGSFADGGRSSLVVSHPSTELRQVLLLSP